MCRLRWLPSLAPDPSKIEKAPFCATQVVSIYGSRTSSIPLSLRDRRNPPDYKRASARMGISRLVLTLESATAGISSTTCTDGLPTTGMPTA